MARVVWDQLDQKRYEYGVDRGVFYDSAGFGVVWNGLLSVDESAVGGANDTYHFDGIKYLDVVSPRNYQALLSAYGTPLQFDAVVGEHSIVPGFILTRQTRERFGLSYRTLIGGTPGYKIHIVYNILASPTKRGSSTMKNSGNAEKLSWKISAVPPVSKTHRPTAHFILDSLQTPPEALSTVEDILYGTDTTPPRIPTPDELKDLVILMSVLYIFPQPATGLSELRPGMGDLSRTQLAGIHRALPQTKLAPTSVSGIYRLELSKNGL